MKAPVGVILAGGAARRMGGGDKGLLPLGTGTVLDEVIARVSPQVAGLALNANGDAARFAPLGLEVLADTVADLPGPLAGVLAGLAWARKQGADHLVTVPCDTPFLPPDLVPCLLLAAETAGRPVAMAETEAGTHPACALWSVTLDAALAEALAAGRRRVRDFADAVGFAAAAFPDERAFLNVNTPGDLERARAML